MPRRRQIGRGLENVSQVLNLFLQDRLLRGRQAEQQKMSAEQSAAQQRGQLLSTLIGKDDIDPDLIASIFPDADVAGLRDVAGRRQRRQIGEDIGAATSPEAVPSAGAIRRRAFETGQGRVDLPFRMGDERIPSGLMVDQPDIAGLIAEAGLRREDLKTSTRRTVSPLSISGVEGPLDLTGTQLIHPFDVPEGGQFVRSQARPEAKAQQDILERQTDLGLGGPGLRGEVTAQETLAGDESPAVQAAKARGAGMTAAAQEQEKRPGWDWITTADGQVLFRRPQPGDQPFDEVAARAQGLTPSMRAGLSRLTTSMNILRQLDPVLTQRTGVRGRIAGTAQQWWARLTGEEDPVVVYDATSESLLPALARSSGEVGNLAEKEQARYSRLAPKASDPLNVRQAKYTAIQFIIDSANAGASADEMAPFLDYQRFTTTGVPTVSGDALVDELLQLPEGP